MLICILFGHVTWVVAMEFQVAKWCFHWPVFNCFRLYSSLFMSADVCTLQLSTGKTSTPFFNLSPNHVSLYCFQFFIAINNVTMNVFVHLFLQNKFQEWNFKQSIQPLFFFIHISKFPIRNNASVFKFSLVDYQGAHLSHSQHGKLPVVGQAMAILDLPLRPCLGG